MRVCVGTGRGGGGGRGARGGYFVTNGLNKDRGGGRPVNDLYGVEYPLYSIPEGTSQKPA